MHAGLTLHVKRRVQTFFLSGSRTPQCLSKSHSLSEETETNSATSPHSQWTVSNKSTSNFFLPEYTTKSWKSSHRHCRVMLYAITTMTWNTSHVFTLHTAITIVFWTEFCCWIVNLYFLKTSCVDSLLELQWTANSHSLSSLYQKSLCIH